MTAMLYADISAINPKPLFGYLYFSPSCTSRGLKMPPSRLRAVEGGQFFRRDGEAAIADSPGLVLFVITHTENLNKSPILCPLGVV